MNSITGDGPTASNVLVTSQQQQQTTTTVVSQQAVVALRQHQMQLQQHQQELQRQQNFQPYCCECLPTQNRCSTDACPCFAARRVCEEQCESARYRGDCLNQVR